MTRKATALAFCLGVILAPNAFGFSTDGSWLARSFDKTISPTNLPIVIMATFTNGGASELHGFCYTDQVPSGVAVSPLGVTLNGQAITNYTFESGQDGDVFAGCTPCRWVLESPTNFAEANPIPPQGILQITYSISASTPGSFSFQEFSWAGYRPSVTNESFGFSEPADHQTAIFVKAILTVAADHQARIYGADNSPLTVSYSGFVNGDDTNVLGGSPVLSTTAAANSPPGTYPVTVSQGTLSATNYSLNFVNGTVTVTWPPLLVTSCQVTNGVATITWSSVAGQTYRVQYRNHLFDVNWNDLPPDVTATGLTASKTDVVASPQRFYRVTLVQASLVSPPVIQSIQGTNGIVTIVWSSVAGQTYRVQYKNDLADASWTYLPPDVTASEPTTAKTDFVGGLPQRFYRVILVQPSVTPPVIQSLQNDNAIVTITWSSGADQTYRVQYKNNLNDAIWTDLPLDVTATGPSASTTDTVGSLPQRFYRVRLMPSL